MLIASHVSFLQTEFGFRAVHEVAGDERSMTVLESGQVRSKIEIERGTSVIYFGALDAPLAWGNDRDGKIVWHVDNALLNFIEHRHGLPRESDPVARLRAHLPEIVRAFEAPRPLEWWNAYAAFREQRLREMRKKK